MHKKHINKIATIHSITVILFGTILGCGAYLGDYYHAEDSALEILEHPADTVTITEYANDRIIFEPEAPTCGLIYYPGGKVQYEAYIPLMESLSEENILCVLVHMPGNLAVLNIKAADGIRDAYPEITDWYIGGHSLGGAMASSYLGEHVDDYAGLILMGAYSTEDFSDTDLSVLSIYGSNDQVLSMEKYEENQGHLPADTTELVIDGGCHAYYGCYGPQEGDGTPTISNEEQIAITTQAVADFVQH